MARTSNTRRQGRSSADEASYDVETRRRFGSGGGFFGFGPGGSGLPWVFGVLAFFLLVVCGRLVYLQVIEGPHYAQEAAARRENELVLQARRGTIYDRNGNVLAMSEECYDVYGNPQTIQDTDTVAGVVAKWLGGEESEYRSLLSQDGTFVYLRRKADKEACESMRDELASLKLEGVYLLQQMRRVYPYGRTAGQVLGMVDVDGAGISGIELAYDEQLSGTPGSMIMETGLGGIPIAGASAQTTRPVDGKDLVLSIDIDVQKFVEDQMADAVVANKAESGMCMACNPKTGEIIAACSTPYVDLTDASSITNEGLKLKLVSDSFDPGSIFKVITAAIALESGSAQTGTYFSVPPTILVGQGIVSDDDGRMETMDMNLREVLRRSSNVGAALIAEQAIGVDAFFEGVDHFGIGQLTGIDFPGETTGMVHSKEEYDPSLLGSMAFGQGVTIPMVQMVRAVGAIANQGKLLTPHFVTQVGGKPTEWADPTNAVSADTAEKIADMMCTVTEDGTGYSSQVEGYDVAVKTGTGEQAKDGKYIKGKFLASVIGFAPASDPEVLLYVGLNETPYLSYSSAGPVFSAIMGEVLADMGVLSPQGL
ncbi:MAG: penicillin-binding protein 2 [Coriobacteriales bacterium]|nr:penicillin-binding protein 2 [Coriobacteriales bacterium]